MKKIILKAESRLIEGQKVKTLRRQGIVPAVVYGRGFKPINIQMPSKEFERVYTEAGESTLVYLDVDGQSYPTIIHDVARNPVSEAILHADFYKVRLDEKIHAKIPLNFIGEAPAVKSLGGILVKNIHELEVEGFPQDLPHQIDIDLSKLAEFNSHVVVGDAFLPGGLVVKNKTDEIIALVQEPISEEELKAQLETPAVSAEEVEVIKKEKKEEEKVAEEAAPEPTGQS